MVTSAEQPAPERPARPPFVAGQRRGPKVGDPCPACNSADLVMKGSKMGCPDCWYIQPCCNP